VTGLRKWLARQVPRATRSSAPAAFLAESQWLSPHELARLQTGLRESHGRRPHLVGRTIASSGTSGAPTRARWSVEAMRWQDAAEARSRDWAGLEPGASRVWVCCNPADRLRRLGSLVQNTSIVAAGSVANDEAALGALADRIERRPPDAVQGVSNVLAALARELSRRGVALPGTVCISAGNHLTPWYRRELEAVFARPVRERYAVSEVGLIAASCERGALHVTVETLLVEIGAGGSIEVTMLRNGASARRSVGDVGRLVEVPCPCGRGLPTIELLGRASEQLRLEEDRRVSPSDLFGALDDAAVADARFRHRAARTELEVEIVHAPGQMGDDPVERLARLVGPSTRVVVHDVERLATGASGKLRLVESV
jgi:phenylacetate-CoA ligase